MQSLPKSAREAFYKQIRESAGRTEIEEIIKEYYRATYFEQETSKGNRRYLPLNVWKVKGFDEKRIERIDDKKWDEEMQCFMYGVTVRSKVNEQGRKEVWSKEVGGENQPGSRAVGKEHEEN